MTVERINSPEMISAVTEGASHSIPRLTVGCFRAPRACGNATPESVANDPTANFLTGSGDHLRARCFDEMRLIFQIRRRKGRGYKSRRIHVRIDSQSPPLLHDE